LLFFVSRQGFRHVDVSQSADIADKLDYQGFLLMEMVRQYTPVGAALAGFGLVQQFRRLNLSTAFALLAGWLGSSLVLGAMLGFDYEPLMKAAIRRYPLIPYGILAVCLVLALDALTSRVLRAPNLLRQRRPSPRVLDEGRRPVLGSAQGYPGPADGLRSLRHDSCVHRPNGNDDVQ